MKASLFFAKMSKVTGTFESNVIGISIERGSQLENKKL